MSDEKSVVLLDCLATGEETIRAVQQGGASDSTLPAARLQVGRAICAACGITNLPSTATLSAIVEAAVSATNGRRVAAIIVLRAVAVEGLLPFEADHQLARRVIELIEGAYVDQLRGLRLPDKRQNFEKLSAIKGFHGSMCHELQPFASSGQTLADIDALVPDLQRVIRSGPLGRIWRHTTGHPSKRK